MSLLEIENLTVEFQTSSGLFRAVDGVSLACDKGEILSVVGESGSGKSVAMNTTNQKSSTGLPGASSQRPMIQPACSATMAG